jgi:hypothetical protein
LLRVLPELTLIRKAWKAHFSVHGCVSCRRKKTDYGAGAFCYKCLNRITVRMRTCFRKVSEGETSSLKLLLFPGNMMRLSGYSMQRANRRAVAFLS